LKKYFEKFGRVHFVKLANPTAERPMMAFIRMETPQSQKKLLDYQGLHQIEGCEIEVHPPQRRIFIGRIPDEITTSELLRFFGDEARKINPAAYAVDVYRPMPYRQFAFAVFGEIGNVAEIIARKKDLVMNGAPLTCSYFPFSVDGSMPESAIVEFEANNNGTPALKQLKDVDIKPLFARKISELAASEPSKARSLESIASEVEFVMSLMLKEREQNSQTTICQLLDIINVEFMSTTEDKLRKYLGVQSSVFLLCKAMLIGVPNEAANSNNTEPPTHIELGNYFKTDMVGESTE